MPLICDSDKAKYFSSGGLTRIREIHLSGKSPDKGQADAPLEDIDLRGLDCGESINPRDLLHDADELKPRSKAASDLPSGQRRRAISIRMPSPYPVRRCQRA